MNKVFNKDVIKDVLNNLSQERPIFCSEADFQLELCRYIRNYLVTNNIKEFKILPEYYYCPNNESPMYIDILVIVDKKWYPFELKYKTKGNSDTNVLLKYEDKECEFILKNHGAHDNNCYKYLYDIFRIEKIRKDNNINFGEGYAIMLSNDSKYWEGPKNEICYYRDFVIKDNKTIPDKEDLKWDEKASIGTIKGCEMPLKFDDKYEMKWKEYGSELSKDEFKNAKMRNIEEASQFKYLISVIGSKD